MPAFDKCHDQVVNAFRSDGWTLVSSPLALQTGRQIVFIDAWFSRPENGTRAQALLVEIKCFQNEDSLTTDLYTAIGQYLVYRAMLERQSSPAHPIYLAIPSSIFERVFDTIVIKVIQEARIHLVIVDLDEEKIVRWYN